MQQNILCFKISRPFVTHTGAKDKDDIYKAFENIYPVLGQFRKGDVPIPNAALPQASQTASLVRHLYGGFSATSVCSQLLQITGLAGTGIGMLAFNPCVMQNTRAACSGVVPTAAAPQVHEHVHEPIDST